MVNGDSKISILPCTVRNALVRKKGVEIAGPFDLDLGVSGITIVMGPNGSGKTTLLRLLHGLERPRKGEVVWAVANQEAQMQQAFVFQTPIMMRRSVRANIAYPLVLRGHRRKAAHLIAQDWAERIGLRDRLDQDAQVLSGGEKQKLAIARALSGKPEVLFLDEPTTNLDGSATRDIEALLLEAHRDGARIVMTTHNTGQARRLANDVVFLHKGRVRETGAAQTFFERPATPEAAAFLNGDIVE